MARELISLHFQNKTMCSYVPCHLKKKKLKRKIKQKHARFTEVHTGMEDFRLLIFSSPRRIAVGGRGGHKNHGSSTQNVLPHCR